MFNSCASKELVYIYIHVCVIHVSKIDELFNLVLISLLRDEREVVINWDVIVVIKSQT